MKGFLKKIWRIIKLSCLASIISALLVLTPLFADMGVIALNLFSKITLKSTATPANATVVLGGGLTKKDGKILLNHYSRSRADAVIALHEQNALPIITSGAESPWLQDYLKQHLASRGNRPIIISDNASMNTCENAIFTAKLLSHHEIGTTVNLITDRYHMARARRQFARAGIDTIAQPANLDISPSWTDFRKNLVHSRRTAYEMAALARDIFRPQNNCRNSDQITLEEISTPRRKAKVFSLITY